MSGTINNVDKQPRLIVGFDGINRVGKGTQALLLKNFLVKNGITSEILRGDGSREGIGQQIPFDPNSIWRQMMRQRLKNLSGHIYDEMAWDEAARRLNRELYYFVNRNCPVDVVILDRTIFSRWVTKSQHMANVKFHDLLFFYDGKCGKEPSNKKNTIVPDILFILKGETSYLLDRLEKSFDGNQVQYNFRRNIILKYNDFFNKKIDELPAQLKNKAIVIDAASSIDSIRNIVQHNIIHELNYK